VVSKNVATREARERAARLADRRRQEEAQFATIATGLAAIAQTVTNLESAVELGNGRIRTASVDIARAVDALAELGFRPADIASVVGVGAKDLRPGLSLSLRRTRNRPRRQPTARAAELPEPPPTGGDTAGVGREHERGPSEEPRPTAEPPAR
jgi:hypothetical protein